VDGYPLSKEFRHIVRITETDLAGTEKVAYALSNIKGIGVSLANAILRKAGINPETRIGNLTETDTEKIGDIMRNPDKYNIPSWFFNRRKDFETGKNIHLIGSDLVLRSKLDIDQMKTIRSWRGYRHSYGLKVRGQRTKTTGRSGKAMGVKKKALIQAARKAEFGGGKE
jgi:small subunit ribosomal protein S13